MASALTIERMYNVYRVAADDPAPDELRFRLDKLAANEVVHACRSRLAEWLDDDDPSIWIIRLLDVDLAVDASACFSQHAGSAWGEHLALEISRTLERGQSDVVVRFPNRAAYLAQWARDMVAGRAWDKWYYADFDSLRSLSQSAAITEGILREPGARDVVLCFHREEALESVLATLTANDADRLYRGLGGSGNDDARWVSRLLAVWNSALNSQSRIGDKIRLWAAVASEWSDDADYTGLDHAINQLLDLRDLLAQIGSADLSQQFLAKAAAGQFREARSLLTGRQIHLRDTLLDFVRTASSGNADWAGFTVETVAPHSTSNREESFLSEFGGIFLLTSAFHDLQIEQALHAAANDSGEQPNAEAILRFLLAVRCLGADRAASAIHDRAVMEFAGMPSSVTLDQMASILKAADAQSAYAAVEGRLEELYDDGLLQETERHGNYFALGSVLPEFELRSADEDAWSRIATFIIRVFARHLPGFAKSSPEYIFRNFLAGTSQVRIGKNTLEVFMGRCPLSVVLRIAGAYRTLALPWREGVEVCLLMPSD